MFPNSNLFRSFLNGKESGRNPTKIIILILALALAYWLWVGTTQRSVEDSAALSIIAAQGILDNGLQVFPSGYLYHRGYIPHYALAGILGVVGLSNFSIMILSLLFGLGTLIIVYLIARDILQRPWIGVFAVVLLMGLQIESFYAVSPRMYIGLQFFTTLVAYSAWRGYVKGESRFRLIAFLALLAAILSHREGVLLVIAVPAALIVAIWVTRAKLPSVNLAFHLVGITAVAAACFFVAIYSPPGGIPAISAHGGLSTGSTGLNLNPIQVAISAFQLERALPFGLVFLPVVIYLSVKHIIYRDSNAGHTPIYLMIIFTVAAILVLISTTRNGARLWVFLLPFYALLVISALATIADSFNFITKRRNSIGGTERKAVVVALLVVGVVVNFALVSLASESNLELARAGYGIPCQGTKCDASVRQHHETLLDSIGPQDVIISTNPTVSRFYLGRVDGFLRQKRLGDGGFTTFQHSSDEYLGVSLIDSIDELQDLHTASGKRVWVITDRFSKWAYSEETRSFLKSDFTLFLEENVITTYVNCVELPCQSTAVNQN